MRKLLVGVGLLVLGAAGCATSTQLERESRAHLNRADALASTRDYDRASQEKGEADRLHRKAVKKAYKEGNAASVAVPGAPVEVPSSSAPLAPAP